MSRETLRAALERIAAGKADMGTRHEGWREAIEDAKRALAADATDPPSTRKACRRCGLFKGETPCGFGHAADYGPAPSEPVRGAVALEDENLRRAVKGALDACLDAGSTTRKMALETLRVVSQHLAASRRDGGK